MKQVTRKQLDDLATTLEEASCRNHNSTGAWHALLIAEVVQLGYDVRSYDEAKRIAQGIVHSPR